MEQEFVEFKFDRPDAQDKPAEHHHTDAENGLADDAQPAECLHDSLLHEFSRARPPHKPR